MSTQTSPRQTTKKIAGHKVTLTKGINYIATRPFCRRGLTVFPVTICQNDTTNTAPVEWRIDGLTLAEANAFCVAFNSKSFSFYGRTW
jgi:hypothetical protein